MALKANKIVAGVKIPVYIRVLRTFGGKTEQVGSMVQIFAGHDKPEEGARTAFPDFNSVPAPWSATEKNEVVAYESLKESLGKDPEYADIEDC